MNNIIIVDPREKGHKKILEYFEKVELTFICAKSEMIKAGKIKMK